VLKYLLCFLFILVYLKANALPPEYEKSYQDFIKPFTQSILDNWDDPGQLTVDGKFYQALSNIVNYLEGNYSIPPDSQGIIKLRSKQSPLNQVTSVTPTDTGLEIRSQRPRYLEFGTRMSRKTENTLQMTIYRRDRTLDNSRSFIISSDSKVSYVKTSEDDIRRIKDANLCKSPEGDVQINLGLAYITQLMKIISAPFQIKIPWDPESKQF
jgi:hypothetical protein